MYHGPLFVSVIDVRGDDLQLAAPLIFSVRAIISSNRLGVVRVDILWPAFPPVDILVIAMR